MMKVICKFEKETIENILTTEQCTDTSVYVSDFCKKAFYCFLPGETHLIECGTGKGKSYMVSNMIIPNAFYDSKKVLLLVNRKKLEDQYISEIQKAVCEGIVKNNPITHSITSIYDKCLTVKSYQMLEQELSNRCELTLQELNKYDIVIADEVHYLLSDANFNTYTSLSAEAILMYLGQKTRYFMSATMEYIREIILNPGAYITPRFSPKENYYREVYTYENYKVIHCNNAVRYYEYVMQQDYGYLDVYYYKRDNVILDYILNSSKDEKWVYFVSDKNKGESLVEKINKSFQEKQGNTGKKDTACFISAEYRNEGNHVMKETMDDITSKGDTNYRVIVTTSVLDNGINLKSEELLHVVIDTDNKVSFIQMLGRKRLVNENEKVNLYIPMGDRKMFEGRLKAAEEIINVANKVSSSIFDSFASSCLHSNNENCKVLRKFSFPFVLELAGQKRTTFMINELSIHQARLLYKNYKKIIDNYDKYGESGFIVEQLSWIGLDYDQSKWIPDTSFERCKINIEKILAKYKDKKLSSTEFDDLLTEIIPYVKGLVKNVRSNRLSAKSANEAMDKIGSMYYFDAKEKRVTSKNTAE